MRTRNRTDEATIQIDHRTRTTYLHAAYNIPLTTHLSELPDLVLASERERADWTLDQMIQEALFDLVQRYWIPVPPIQFRVQPLRSGTDYFGRTEVRERRIRMLKPELGHVDLAATNPLLSVRFRVDWGLDELPQWNSYIPEYYEESQRGEMDAAPPGEAQPPAAGELRPGFGADAAANIPAR